MWLRGFEKRETQDGMGFDEVKDEYRLNVM